MLGLMRALCLTALCLATTSAGADLPFRPPAPVGAAATDGGGPVDAATAAATPADPAPTCSDTRSECEMWARDGQCVLNP